MTVLHSVSAVLALAGAVALAAPVASPVAADQHKKPSAEKPLAEVKLLTVEAKHDFQKTVKRLKGAVKSRGMKVIATIDHAKGAEKAGMDLRPTTLVIFGNPKVGTPLMQDNQLVGLDLPMKVLVHESEEGTVNLTYRAPDLLAHNWRMVPVPGQIEGMTKGLAAIVAEAAAREQGQPSM
ncbi:DUF302 domain-containing protein [Yunchengibacter salinarum]|uniref:DUF302 domain-containing protein n=1 Tax=Yunchengibacter salinarum TaxID=3133399 RepID=UPI0035B60997